MGELPARQPLSPRGYQAGMNPAINTQSEQIYYSRQQILPEIGQRGLDLLKSARVLVVGAGGLGCPALSYLATAGVGLIGICDGDRVSLSNLHRQILFSYADIGDYKVQAAIRRLAAMNPFISFQAHSEALQASHAREWVRQYDLVLDCTDNFESKFLIHDACFFEKKPLIQASIYQFEGQLQVYTHQVGQACLRCLWPVQPPANCVGSCAEAGVLGVVPGLLGTWQASEALKILLGLSEQQGSETLILNLLRNDCLRLAQPVDPDCPLCGRQAQIHDVILADVLEIEGEIHKHQLDSMNPQQSRYRWVDIRSLAEREASPDWLQQVEHIPMHDIAALRALSGDQDCLLICSAGQRSARTASMLRAEGMLHIYSLINGINGLDH